MADPYTIAKFTRLLLTKDHRVVLEFTFDSAYEAAIAHDDLLASLQTGEATLVVKSTGWKTTYHA